MKENKSVKSWVEHSLLKNAKEEGERTEEKSGRLALAVPHRLTLTCTGLAFRTVPHCLALTRTGLATRTASSWFQSLASEGWWLLPIVHKNLNPHSTTRP